MNHFLNYTLLLCALAFTACISERDMPPVPDDNRPTATGDSIEYQVVINGLNNGQNPTNKSSRGTLGDLQNVKAVYILTDMVSPLNTCFGYLDINPGSDGKFVSKVKFNDAFKGKEVILDVLLYDGDAFPGETYYNLVANSGSLDYRGGLESIMSRTGGITTGSKPMKFTGKIERDLTYQAYSNKFVLGTGGTINLKVNRMSVMVKLKISANARKNFRLEKVRVYSTDQCVHKFDLTKASFNEAGYPVLDASCMWSPYDYNKLYYYEFECKDDETGTPTTDFEVPIIGVGINAQTNKWGYEWKNCIVIKGGWERGSWSRSLRIDFMKDGSYIDCLPNNQFIVTLDKFNYTSTDDLDRGYKSGNWGFSYTLIDENYVNSSWEL